MSKPPLAITHAIHSFLTHVSNVSNACHKSTLPYKENPTGSTLRLSIALSNSLPSSDIQ